MVGIKANERILRAAYELAAQRPFDKITFADVAKVAGVHWTAVRRHFGDKQAMRKLLAERQAASGQALADTRTRILAAAAGVFAEYGYAGATLEQVAAAAGLTKGAVYWHFSGKSDLFLALCDLDLTQQVRLLPEQVQNVFTSSDPVQALAALLQTQLECCGQGDGRPMLFFEFITSSREPAVREKLRATYAGLFDAIGSVLKELQAGGLIKNDVNPHMLAVMFQALINGSLLAWLIDPERVQFDSLMPEIARVIWEGLHPAKS